MNAKMDGYLTKPLITKDLVKTLSDLNPTLKPPTDLSSTSSSSEKKDS